MKPRLRLRHGVWSCGLRYHRWVLLPPIGYGYTPAEAFREWRLLSSTEGAVA